jgi:hypothetical protein
MATQPARLTKEFWGREESEIAIKFRAWKEEMWGKIRILKEHPIEHRGLDMKAGKFGEPNLGNLTDDWSMLVEYENVGGDDGPNKPANT